MFNYNVFILIKYLKAFKSFNFIIVLVRFKSPLIHLTYIISRRLST
jgi:hypothetical protein